MMDLPSYKDVAAARDRIKGDAVVTPLISSPRADARLGGMLLIKAEPLQRTGSFKFRGAANSVAMLDASTRTVVAWSSGNHAQAVAAAATARGLRSIIVMPEDAPETKKAGTAELGGDVVTYDRYTESREDIGQALAREHDAAIIPPYDFAPVIAGQGTIGIEIAEQIDARGISADQLICCTGGGGLLSGLSLGLHEHLPDLEIIAAEPEGFDDFRRSIEAGERLANIPGPKTICDAIVTPTPGELTFAINRQHVSHGVAVSDDEVLAAMAFAWSEYKLVIEPGGAVALAAALSGKVEIRGKTTVIVASGGNVDRDIFKRALEMPEGRAFKPR
ncbi:threonine/serine dehydratase [Alphaproteobacteria bacterium LSUCC0684]